MINETLGLEKMEISTLIRELRKEKKIQQDVLYKGLCKSKVYFQMENGDVIMDELLSESLFSRLHVQYRLMDIMLNDDNFWQKECRYEINTLLHRRCWEQVERLLVEYEERAPKVKIHTQYILAKRAELLFQTKQETCGVVFREALELTMSISEIEKRLQDSGVISTEELWMYFRYRSCEKPLSLEEYALLLEKVERWFLSAQIYAEIYFEAAYQYALELWEIERYVTCREICEKAIYWLKCGLKSFHLAEFYFLDAMAGMKLKHREDEEKAFFQQCKMAYYVSLSFGEKEIADKILKCCWEELEWHIIA